MGELNPFTNQRPKAGRYSYLWSSRYPRACSVRPRVGVRKLTVKRVPPPDALPLAPPLIPLPRIARAAMMGQGSTDVQFTCVVNRQNLDPSPHSSNPATSRWSSARSIRSARQRTRSLTCLGTMPQARLSSLCSSGAGSQVWRRAVRIELT